MPDQVPPAIQMLILERVDRRCNMQRYYVLAVTPTMFGEPALVREWGRIGKSVRRSIELHADDGRAAEALQTRVNRKTKRSYLIAPDIENREGKGRKMADNGCPLFDMDP